MEDGSRLPAPLADILFWAAIAVSEGLTESQVADRRSAVSA